MPVNLRYLQQNTDFSRKPPFLSILIVIAARQGLLEPPQGDTAPQDLHLLLVRISGAVAIRLVRRASAAAQVHLLCGLPGGRGVGSVDGNPTIDPVGPIARWSDAGSGRLTDQSRTSVR